MSVWVWDSEQDCAHFDTIVPPFDVKSSRRYKAHTHITINMQNTYNVRTYTVSDSHDSTKQGTRENPTTKNARGIPMVGHRKYHVSVGRKETTTRSKRLVLDLDIIIARPERTTAKRADHFQESHERDRRRKPVNLVLAKFSIYLPTYRVPCCVVVFSRLCCEYFVSCLYFLLVVGRRRQASWRRVRTRCTCTLVRRTLTPFLYSLRLTTHQFY